VVIPTCGRPALLKRCLDALARQTLHASRIEIIVVDDSRSRRGPAAARNDGWRRARAPIIAFTDDDTEPDPAWLENGLAAFSDEVDAVSGRIVMPVPGTPTDYERDARGLERGEFVTANCFCRKGILEEIDGFDEHFRLAWREDSDLQFRLMQAGARILHEPRAVVVHPVRPAPWGVSLRQQRKVMFDALLYKKHRKLYRERIRARPRWDYYAIVAALFGGLLAALLSAYELAFLLAVVWVGFTATFCLHRLRGTSRAPLHVLEVILTSAAIPPLAVFWRVVGALKFRVAFI
jgi:GT2 family glycosyltransferase